MKMKTGLQNILITAAMVSIVTLVLKYHDTAVFQSAMTFLFNPDASIALPAFWHDNRLVITGCLMTALFVYYNPTWFSYQNLIQLYRSSPESNQKPPLTAPQASYFYRQDQTLCLVSLFMVFLHRGVLALHYRKGKHPWSISRGPNHKKSSSDQQLVDILFQHNDRVRLQASFSDPDPDVKAAADKFYKHMKSENRHLFHSQKSSLPAWLFLFALIAEIPFYMASRASMEPGTIVITLFSAAVVTAPAYVLCNELPSFFSGINITAYIKLVLASMFVLFCHWLLFNNPAKAPYYATALYPDIAVVLIVMVYKAPLLPKDSSLLRQIVGYKKYLGHDGYRIREEDLPWTLGLGVHTDIIERSFQYAEQTIPDWLQTTELDVQPLMKALHQTLYQHVNEAINGERESKSRLGGGGIERRI